MERFTEFILKGVTDGCSDMHITGGQPVIYRKDGIIVFEKDIAWKPEEVDALVKDMLNPHQLMMLKKRYSVDFAMTIKNIRIRVNVFNTIRGLSLAVRILPGTAPTISDLNLHPSLKEIRELKFGLVLICGPTGSGKSSTITAIIEEINNIRSAHIVSLEDPIEFRYLQKKAFIEQRELSTHMPSFNQGLIDILREDPDVIVVGELREPENIRLTLNAVESGHVVIATLHASNSEDAVYRICNSFPPESQEEIRAQLASTLSWIIVQQLVYLDRIKFRVPVLSICRGCQSIKSIIRENKLPQIENAIHTGKNEGMFTMSRYMNEYINVRQTFNHPSMCFMPSEESVYEKEYVSPLLDAQTYDVTVAEAFSYKQERQVDRAVVKDNVASKEIADEKPH